MKTPETEPRQGPSEPPARLVLVPRPRSGVAATITATLAVVAGLWWGQRFLIPLTAGLMLAMLVMPLTIFLKRLVRSAVAATVLTLLLVLGALAAGVMAFGSQLLNVAERAPEMISMVAQQLAKGEHRADSP